ncbi:DUF2950 domain-containing protein [Pseudomonas sp. RW407]|uniref:DUF2950 domain-containing protein n=1 Tax=Pseudomonas sp. RW407 TaxID=2202894 RepID=UPI000D6FC766|nr:DUF2950 domain-containing protein [Pseudomonas sp. RW407]PWU26889.1 DUF2950 domain-containing protein [Pseudomonas sp. RW407]
MSRIPRIALLSLLPLLAPLAQAQQVFKTPDEAAAAFVAALGTQHADAGRLAALLGDDWRTYIPARNIERKDVDAFLALYKQKHVIHDDGDDRAHLVVGDDGWTLPLSLQHGKRGWAFDAKGSVEEIRDRRIGRNELATIQAVQAYHDAQLDYASVDRNGDGLLEYAQKFQSSDGKFDGLYWAEQPGVEQSPLGPLFGDAKPGGEWHGYHYRILTAQGPSAPGGAYDYRIGGHMTRGFALVAWPARYGDSGVMSFMISHDGEVFEKDMGPDSARLALAMKRFDPDSSWTEVKDAANP